LSGGGVVVGPGVVVGGSNIPEPVGREVVSASVDVSASSAALTSAAIEEAAAWAEESADEIEARSDEAAVDAAFWMELATSRMDEAASVAEERTAFGS